MHHDKKVIIGLKKARTSLDTIIKMIESDTYCIDIIQQNLAVIWLLKNINLNMLEWHVNHCYKDALWEWNCCKIDDMTKELLNIIKIAQNK